MPVKQRENGSYQVTVCVGGRTLRKASRHWTFQEAREYERKLIAAHKDATLGRKPERTIAEALERWLTQYVPKMRSARDTEYHARALLPFIHGRKLSEAPKVWAEVKIALSSKAAATINHKGRILRRLCNLALTEWEWTDVPIGKRIRLLTEVPKERYLSADEVERLAGACKNMAVGDYVRLAAYTGIRQGHLLRLTASDVKDGWISLDRTSKTRTLQMVPVHPRVAEIAARLPLGVTKSQCFASWSAAQKATGIKARWHDLRHTCASWLVESGSDMLTVRDMLGHSTITMAQRYAHRAPKHLKDAISKVA